MSATLALLVVTPLEAPSRLAAMLAVAALALEGLERVVLLRGRRAVRRFRLQRDGGIEVEAPSGARRAGAVRPGSFVAPWLTVVRWRAEGGWRDRTILLLPDMVEAEAFRRLRVLLRWA